jgi:chromosome partitioning protein
MQDCGFMVETQNLVSLFEEYAMLAEAVQRRIIEIDNKPEQKKRLRLFPTREAADLLGISDSYLRRLVLDDAELPQGEALGPSRRGFRLDEINAIRGSLLARTGDARYRVGRDAAAGDRLQVLALCNFKGGAAKTTTAVHLSQYLALRGYRVLLIDLDSQASATGLFGFHPDEDLAETDTLYGFMGSNGRALCDLTRPTYISGLDLLPANLGLYRVEFELPVRQMKEANFRFWRLLGDGLATVDDRYDVIVCDCPPSLGYLTINALYAATGLIVPAPPSMLDFASTGRFFRMMADTLADIEAFEGGPPKSLDFVRILLTKVHTTDRNQQRIAAWMTATFGDRLLDARMAHTTALDQAGNVKRTLYELEPGSGRKAQERGIDFLDRVNAEIEALILAQWQRSKAREAA